MKNPPLMIAESFQIQAFFESHVLLLVWGLLSPG